MTDEERGWLRGEFERCAPYIQRALDRDIGTHDLADVWDLIAERKAQLWPLPNSAVVTVLEFFPRKTLLRYWLCGGDERLKERECLKECLSIQDTIEDWAKSAGAAIAGIGGREGWLGVLPGFKKTSVFMIKVL